MRVDFHSIQLDRRHLTCRDMLNSEGSEIFSKLTRSTQCVVSRTCNIRVKVWDQQVTASRQDMCVCVRVPSAGGKRPEKNVEVRPPPL